MANVEIYFKPTCPYCQRAMSLLQGKGVNFTSYDVSDDEAKRQEMIKRADGASTVPQIFIDGKHVGGCDDIHALDAAGKLDPLL